MSTEWTPGKCGLFTSCHDLMLPPEDPAFLPPIPAKTYFKVLAVDQETMIILIDEFEWHGQTWSNKITLFRSGKYWTNMARQIVPIQLDEWPGNGTPAIQEAHSNCHKSNQEPFAPRPDILVDEMLAECVSITEGIGEIVRARRLSVLPVLFPLDPKIK